MAKKITQLDASTSVLGTDIIEVSSDPRGPPITNKITTIKQTIANNTTTPFPQLKK